MLIRPSCSLKQQLLMPALCVVLKVGRDGLPALNKCLWLVYAPALEPGMRKAAFCFVLAVRWAAPVLCVAHCSSGAEESSVLVWEEGTSQNVPVGGR